MKVSIFLLILCGITGIICAQELTLTLETDTNQVILGLPVELKIVLQGNTPFNLNEEFSIDCENDAGISVTDQSGHSVDFSTGAPPCPEITEPLTKSRVMYNDRAEDALDIFLRSGLYKVQAFYRLKQSETAAAGEQSNWEGEIRSNQISVEVKMPEGEDRNALVNLGPAFNGTAEDYAMFIPNHRKELLKEYPKSTYTSELILDYIDIPDNEDPKQVKKLMEAGNYPGGNAVPDPNSESGFSFKGTSKMLAEWYTLNLPIILNASRLPKSKADKVKLALGLSHMALGNKNEASRILHAVAKEDTKQGKWARNFIVENEIQPQDE